MMADFHHTNELYSICSNGSLSICSVCSPLRSLSLFEENFSSSACDSTNHDR